VNDVLSNRRTEGKEKRRPRQEAAREIEKQDAAERSLRDAESPLGNWPASPPPGDRRPTDADDDARLLAALRAKDLFFGGRVDFAAIDLWFSSIVEREIGGLVLRYEPSGRRRWCYVDRGGETVP
jgi:hypothetical protein